MSTTTPSACRSGIASLTGAINLIVTILNMRAPGMTLMRMPPFTWMALVTQFLLVFSLPVITVALILLTFDRTFDANFFNVDQGADPLLWQHLFWIFGHPEVYILILPAFGIVSDTLPVFSRKPLFGYPFVVFSGIAIGFMGWGVWAHHMFASGLGPVSVAAFALTTMFIAVPTGVKILNWLATMWGGNIRFTAAALFSISLVAMFTIGGLSGVMHSIAGSDTQQTDTYFIVAHFHYVLFGGALQGLFAGVYYWYPKAFGHMLNEKLGKWHFWFMIIGFNLTFGPFHLVGLQGQPRRTYRYDPELGLGFWNMVSTIGAFTIAAGLLIFFYNVWYSKRHAHAGAARPVGRADPGVVDPVAGAGAQLRLRPGGRLPGRLLEQEVPVRGRATARWSRSPTATRSPSVATSTPISRRRPTGPSWCPPVCPSWASASSTRPSSS